VSGSGGSNRPLLREQEAASSRRSARRWPRIPPRAGPCWRSTPRSRRQAGAAALGSRTARRGCSRAGTLGGTVTSFESTLRKLRRDASGL